MSGIEFGDTVQWCERGSIITGRVTFVDAPQVRVVADGTSNQQWQWINVDQLVCDTEIPGQLDMFDDRPPVCDQFTPDTGGAHPWCATCGWQQPDHTARTARYQAYAAAHDRTPEAMLAHDRQRSPGGQMTGYTRWIAEQWDAFGIPIMSRSTSDAEQDAFTTWLTERTTP